jgi:hypothetical protein
VRDDPDKIARDLCARATVHEMAKAAEEIAAMVRAILAPLPTLPLDPVARELALRVSLSQTRDEARRLLAVICN